MTGFHAVRIPDNTAYGATGGPEFATTVVATSAGHEKRNANWAEARVHWDVASGLKKQAQLDELIAFFQARRGKAYGFRPPFDHVLMFKVLILQTQNNLSEERTEFYLQPTDLDALPRPRAGRRCP